MKGLYEPRCWYLSLAALCVGAGQAFALTISSLTPSDYETDPLSQGISYYIDSSDTVTGVPPALAAGTLIRTEQADASGGTVSFDVDGRAEVYVCYDSRASAPAWLSSWVDTDMTVQVSDAVVGEYDVYARRFDAGAVSLSGNEAAAMYFVVVKESAPVLPRKGWVILVYNMPYLRTIIKQAPEYEVNHIQLSHDIVMNTYQVLDEPGRRANINELIDLAHAYGVSEVTLWTHEICQHGMPSAYRCNDPGHPAYGRADGNNPDMWAWIAQRYVDLFTAGTGCPELDGVVLTFSEVDDNVYAFPGEPPDPRVPGGRTVEFKYDGHTPSEAVAKTIETIQNVCAPRGKSFFPRIWVGFDSWARTIIKEGIEANDSSVWMMHKNVGGIDWPNMDTYHELTGALPSRQEMIEFDICGEYMGHGESTFVMTAYLKDHWNYALDRGADGAVARIGRGSDMMYYTANRISMYGLKEILANPAADPRAINLAWCQQYFPPEIAADLADHYDNPCSPWEGDTRYMTWHAYTSYAPISTDEGLGIAYAAIARVEKHQILLEAQTTLDTWHGVNDYDTLYNGIMNSITRLGGSYPGSSGYSDFQPASTPDLRPDCSITVRALLPGLDPDTAWCEYSIDGGANWDPWPASCTGLPCSFGPETVSAQQVPFDQRSGDQNLIRFYVDDLYCTAYQSDPMTVEILAGPDWTDFQPDQTEDLTPDCSVTVTATGGMQLNGATVTYAYSVNGGRTWTDCPPGGEPVYSGDANGGTIEASDVPFNQLSETLNKIRFSIEDTGQDTYLGPIHNVRVYEPGSEPDPTKAANPDPAHQAANVERDKVLSWAPGERAISHDVYFGTSNPPPFQRNQTDIFFYNGFMDYETTYFLRVDEVGDAGTLTGDVWSFTTVQAPEELTGVWIDLGTTNVADGMTHPQCSDGDTVGANIAARNCRRNDNPGGSPRDLYFYFAVSDSYAYQGSRPQQYITIEYYDTGSGTLQLQYDSSDFGIDHEGKYKNGGEVSLTGAGAWKKHTYYVNDAYFGNRQNAGADFRIAKTGAQEYFYMDLVNVSEQPPGPQDPMPDIDADPTSGVVPLTVNFDGSDSYDPDGTIVLYEWDFEDDGTVDDTGATASHEYTEVGDYTARLTVTDNDNRTGTTTIGITVEPQPADLDNDGDVDQQDFGRFQACLTGPGVTQADPDCQGALLDGDNDVDTNDFGIFQACISGPNVPADPHCAD